MTNPFKILRILSLLFRARIWLRVSTGRSHGESTPFMKLFIRAFPKSALTWPYYLRHRSQRLNAVNFIISSCLGHYLAKVVPAGREVSYIDVGTQCLVYHIAWQAMGLNESRLWYLKFQIPCTWKTVLVRIILLALEENDGNKMQWNLYID